MKRSVVLFLGLVVVASFISVKVNAQNSAYRVVQSIALTGDGGWDYLSVDEINQKLFVSHSSQVNVVDLKTDAQIAVIPETDGVHGIAVANDLNKAFVSCGRDSSVLVIDLKTFKPLGRIQVTGKNPDCILYDAFSKKVFTFNGRSANSTVIDAKTEKVIGTIPLTGKPEFAQTNGNGKIYVNIEDKSSLTEIDPFAMKVVKTWSIAPGEEPSGLAFDKANNRLFSVCSNKLMVVSDAASGKVITTAPIGEGCDGVAFDPATKRIFASCGEGIISVIQQESADSYKPLENITTQPGARTITVDNATHHLFVSVADRDPNGGRRAVKPNTFKVLEVESVK